MSSKNQVTLTFAGDADALAKAAQKAEQATAGVADSVSQSSGEMSNAAKSSGDLTGKLGSLGSAVTGASSAFDDVSGSLQALSDLQNYSAEKSQAQKRALSDVRHAQQDYNQALQDGRQAQQDYTQAVDDAAQATLDIGQAAIDLQQAQLDAQTAQTAYNQAVKDHGKNSVEAKQAAIDLKQAQQDVTQAVQDGKQAQDDAKQATLDQKQALLDGKQATNDAKDAQLDLNDAQRAAHPPELQQWINQMQIVTPLLSGIPAVLGLVTAAQWLWNSSLLASPVTWIVLGIAALIAIIVIIATKTTWFQDIWNAAWGGIKAAAKAVADWFSGPFVGFFKGAFDKVKGAIDAAVGWFKDIPGRAKSALSGIGDAISKPFRAGLNLVSDAWNNTIGKLHWSFPSIFGIGGFSISAPKLPHFHSGGVVPGPVGAETLAVLQGGERVTAAGPSASSGGGAAVTFTGNTDSAVATLIMRLVRDGLIQIAPA